MYEARAVSKSYRSVAALREVNLSIVGGQVHALLGANGAGKSTLVKLLVGAAQPSDGQLWLEGAPVRFANPAQARDAGIAWVAQELTVFPHLDVLENLFLGREPRRGSIVSRRQMRAIARPYLHQVGLDPELAGPVGRLRLGQRQRVEICRALIQRPRILLLDEPTSSLDADETDRLLDVVRGLRDTGVGIVFVSHFLEDVFAVADQITVLRDGRLITAAAPTASLTPREVITAMVGQTLSPHAGARVPLPHAPHRNATRATAIAPSDAKLRDTEPGDDHPGQTNRRLRLSGVRVPGALHDVSFTASPGDIVALAGLEGSGTHAVFDVLFGSRRPTAGNIELPGGRRVPRSIAAAVRAGIAYVPADRGALGLFRNQSVVENIAVVRTLALSHDRFVIRTGEARRRAVERVAQLQVRPDKVDLTAGALSGGNQQKLVLAKWLEARPTVYLLDDPTRGVDVHTRAQMHDLIREVAASGAIVLLASSDLDELCELADRALVFYRGQITERLGGDVLSPHQLLTAINTGSHSASHLDPTVTTSATV